MSSVPVDAPAKVEPKFSVRVSTFAGLEIATVTGAEGKWTSANVVKAFIDKIDLLPGHEYKFVSGDTTLEGPITLEDVFGETCVEGAMLELVGVVTEKESMQDDLNLALIKAAEQADVERVKILLNAGASAAFVHDPPGTWGSADTKSALHEALNIRNAEENRRAVIELLLNAKADVNAERRKSDWRGCGSTKTAFEMLRVNNPSDEELFEVFLASGANPNAVSRRNVASMRSDGYSTNFLLHDAVKANSERIVHALLCSRAVVDAVAEEKIENERGYNRDKEETALHVAIGCGHLGMVKLLLANGANVNFPRKDLDLIEREVDPSETNEEQIDDPREEGYVSPVIMKEVEETALHIAIQEKNADIVAVLIAANADVSATRLHGEVRFSATDLCGDNHQLLGALRGEEPTMTAQAETQGAVQGG
eukprot:TRINITY_DN2928_c0_g2_i1.p1 TRINITY_DN2928_c0_g2~~TRINITY_DN2928_c0_g2_i1.p1  ORF type:complete len:457 (+),score=90.59 TRINITY_DN2928_c0_g2_i1:102-1373(+)